MSREVRNEISVITKSSVNKREVEVPGSAPKRAAETKWKAVEGRSEKTLLSPSVSISEQDGFLVMFPPNPATVS